MGLWPSPVGRRWGRLDDELFDVACLLHDVGLTKAVTGEDVTLRSAEVAADVTRGRRSADAVETLRDGITAHTTPGVSVDHDGPTACYVQVGAICDLGGLRLHHVSDDVVERIRAEAGAVPDGRFTLLGRTGFNIVFRLAPVAEDD